MTRLLCVAVMAMCLAIPVDARADIQSVLIDDILMSPMSEPCKAVAIFVIGGAGAVAVAASAPSGPGMFVTGGLAAMALYYGPEMAQEKCDDFAAVDNATDDWTDDRAGPSWWNRTRYRVICEEHPENEDEEICYEIVEDDSILPSTPMGCTSAGTCVNTLLSGNYGVNAVSVNELVNIINFVEYSTYWDWEQFQALHDQGFSHQYELNY